LERGFKKEIPQETDYYMKRYLLDTSIVIKYLKGTPEVVELIDSLEGEVFSSYLVLAELYEGIFRSKNEVEQKILEYFSTFDLVFGLDETISKEFGKIRAELKQKGTIIEDIDILVAATCLANDLTLVTLNKKHFERIKGLKISTI